MSNVNVGNLNDLNTDLTMIYNRLVFKPLKKCKTTNKAEWVFMEIGFKCFNLGNDYALNLFNDISKSASIEDIKQEIKELREKFLQDNSLLIDKLPMVQRTKKRNTLIEIIDDEIEAGMEFACITVRTLIQGSMDKTIKKTLASTHTIKDTFSIYENAINNLH